MTLAIGHKERGVRVLDAMREEKPPFSPDKATAYFCTLLKSYRVSVVRGDRYAGEWPRERFLIHGIKYEVSDRAKSDLYRDFLPLLNSGQVELLDSSRLVNQIVSLERKTTRCGRDSIDHPPGAIDDLANAVAGVLLGEMKTKGRVRVIQPGVTTRVQELSPEEVQKKDLVRLIDSKGKLLGYRLRYEEGDELRANLMGVYQSGKLVAYSRARERQYGRRGISG